MANQLDSELVSVLLNELEATCSRGDFETARGVAACLCSHGIPPSLHDAFRSRSDGCRRLLLDAMFPLGIRRGDVHDLLRKCVVDENVGVRRSAMLAAARFGLSGLILERCKVPESLTDDFEEQTFAISLIQSLHPYPVCEIARTLHEFRGRSSKYLREAAGFFVLKQSCWKAIPLAFKRFLCFFARPLPHGRLLKSISCGLALAISVLVSLPSLHLQGSSPILNLAGIIGLSAFGSILAYYFLSGK